MRRRASSSASEAESRVRLDNWSFERYTLVSLLSGRWFLRAVVALGCRRYVGSTRLERSFVPHCCAVLLAPIASRIRACVSGIKYEAD